MDEPMSTTKLLALAILGGLAMFNGAGCRQQGATAPREQGVANCVSASKGTPINQTCAIELAKAEIIRREGSQPYSRFSADYDEKGGTWAVVAIFEPEKPGGHMFVLVSNDGRILDYSPGR